MFCVYVCVVVEVMYTCKTSHFGKNYFFYVCVVLEGMYTYKTGHFVNTHLCLCLCYCRGYVHM